MVSREVRRNPKKTTVTFTTDLVTRAIRICSNTKAFGPDKLSIFHLKHLGPRATAYLTALFNDSVNYSRIPSIWKSSIVIPIPKPGKDTSQGTTYRPISLICPAANVLEALILPTVNAHLLPADDQHSDLDTQPPLHYYNLPQTSQLDSTKSHSIGRSASL